MTIATTKLIKVGNSKGVIIPKKMVEELGLQEGEVRIESDGNKLYVIPIRDEPRKGWDKAFKKMHAEGDDKMVFPDVFNDENLTDWQW